MLFPFERIVTGDQLVGRTVGQFVDVFRQQDQRITFGVGGSISFCGRTYFDFTSINGGAK
jgi:hypothetical protein